MFENNEDKVKNKFESNEIEGFVDTEIRAEPDENTDVERETCEAVTEDQKDCIGPKLPPRMTAEEIDSFYKELLAKWKLGDLE